MAASLLLGGLCLVFQAASAHYLGLADTAIELARPGVRILQTLPDDELAELDAGTNEAGVEAGSRRWLQRVAQGWRVTADGIVCVLETSSVRTLPALRALQFDLRYHCADVPELVEIEYPLAHEFEASHRNLARVFIGDRQLPFRFGRARDALRLPLATILRRSGTTLAPRFRDDDPNADLVTGAGDPTVGGDARPSPPPAAAPAPGVAALAAIAATYLPSGIEHILTGPDHLAFVLALVLVPLTLPRLALAVTLFTAAHSVTLGLSFFGVLSLSPSITEPLIALSVAAVGVENLLAQQRGAVLRLRAVTVFCFGLIHGIGLSYQLGELPSGSPLEAAARLLTFNLGVELGQLLVLVFPGLLLVWAVHRDFGRRVTVTGSALLVMLGGLWFVGRMV